MFEPEVGGTFVLTWTELDDTPRSRELAGDVASVGRSPDSDVRFNFGDVSRRHCRLFRKDDAWHVMDDGSLDGTFVNREQVTVPRRLKPGDVIRLGRQGLVDITFRRRAELTDDAMHLARAPANPEHVAVLLALMRQSSSTLDIEDVLGLVVDAALRLTGMSAGHALLTDGRRLSPRVSRGGSGAPGSLGLAIARRAVTNCAPVPDSAAGCLALPLRTFEGDRRGIDTGIHQASGALLLEGRPGQDVDALPIGLLQSACELASVHLAHVAAHERATTDALTGLRNRGWFDQALSRHLRRVLPSESGLALALLDLDHFKNVNDTLGHQAGDQVLVEVARRIRSALKDRGVACRFGGEEMAVLLPLAESDVAFGIVDQIRMAVGSEPVARTDGHPEPISVTLSAGIAVCESVVGVHPERVVKAADLALYAAKQAGRNLVVIAPPLE